MNILDVKFDDHAVDVSFTKSSLHFVLADGREVSAPLEWFPRLRDASNADRKHWRLIGGGIGIHWPNIDEDIAITTILRGYELMTKIRHKARKKTSSLQKISL